MNPEDMANIEHIIDALTEGNRGMAKQVGVQVAEKYQRARDKGDHTAVGHPAELLTSGFFHAASKVVASDTVALAAMQMLTPQGVGVFSLQVTLLAGMMLEARHPGLAAKLYAYFTEDVEHDTNLDERTIGLYRIVGESVTEVGIAIDAFIEKLLELEADSTLGDQFKELLGREVGTSEIPAGILASFGAEVE